MGQEVHMYRQPAYVNLVGCWLLTFVLVTGRMASLTDMNWWWAVAPALAVNGVFAGNALLRGILWKGDEDED